MQSITVSGKKYLLVPLDDSAQNGAPAKETESVKVNSADPEELQIIGPGDWRSEPGAAAWSENVRRHHAETAAFSGPSIATITCDFCAGEVLPSSWMAHQRGHFKEHKNYVCPLCIERFETRQKLNTHVMHHTEPKPNVCIECGKEFYSASGLIRHKRHAHKLPKLVKAEENNAQSS